MSVRSILVGILIVHLVHVLIIENFCFQYHFAAERKIELY